MSNSFGKRGQRSSPRVTSQQLWPVRSSVEANSEPLVQAGVSTASLRAVICMAGGCIITVLAIITAMRELPEQRESGIAPTEIIGPVEEPLQVVRNDEEDADAILRQHLAERERMDREDEERERIRREEDERWERDEEARARTQAEEDRHAELIENEKRKAALMEDLNRQRMEQGERIARQQARAEKQRRAADERRHQEHLAQAKKSEKAIRELNRPRVVPGQIIVPNTTERMMGRGPGLFERD